MKKVSIMALHLGYGGIEKCVCALSNMLIEDYEVEILCSYKLLEEPVFELDPRVKIKYLITKFKPNRDEWKRSVKKLNLFSFIKETYNSIMTLILRKKTMIEAIKNCDADIIISTRVLFNNILSKYGKEGVYKIGWEHNHYHDDEGYAKKVVDSAKALDAFVLVSEGLKEYYKKELTPYNTKCVYIPNTIDYLPSKVSNLKTKRLISVGRLSREKAYDDLLDIYIKLHDIDPTWRLDIIGDGAQKNLLGDKIYSLGLQESVELHGFQKKDYINRLLKDSSIYLMSSITESFGIVLIEAMSFGLPCIAFDSAEGANELIKNNYNGYLVPNRDKDLYVKKVLKVMKDDKLRHKLGENGRQVAMEFTNEKVKEYWLDLLRRSK